MYIYDYYVFYFLYLIQKYLNFKKKKFYKLLIEYIYLF